MDIKIGIDFDNTIINYDNVFHKYAVKYSFIPSEIKKNKKHIRNFIKKIKDGEKKWIELQAMVYGCFIDEAKPAEGINLFLDRCKETSIDVIIISHKTLYPSQGSRINLRDTAMKWLIKNGIISKSGLNEKDIIFSNTREEKLLKIKEQQCTHFIDDMMEVLIEPNFPSDTIKILYSSEKENNLPLEIIQLNNWYEIKEYFFKE